LISGAAIESLIFIGEFFYTLTHGHPWTAILTGVSLVLVGRGRWLLRAFIVIVLIAIIHDAITGQLAQELK
jgi:hypothetical protein